MALADYDPVLQYYADSLTDLDEPTGATKSNPAALTDPTITGSPDSYADFDGTDGVNFLPAAAVLNVGTGDITFAMKARIDTFVTNDVLLSIFDGTGSSTNVGLRVIINSAASVRIALEAHGRSGFDVVTPTAGLTAGQDFIVLWKRTSGTWTLWLDADAAGGMGSVTPQSNDFGSSNITECADVTLGCDRAGTGPFDGRIYWIVGFAAAVADADVQLAAWTDEANLKAAWLGGGGGGSVLSSRATLLGVGR